MQNLREEYSKPTIRKKKQIQDIISLEMWTLKHLETFQIL